MKIINRVLYRSYKSRGEQIDILKKEIDELEKEHKDYKRKLEEIVEIYITKYKKQENEIVYDLYNLKYEIRNDK